MVKISTNILAKSRRCNRPTATSPCVNTGREFCGQESFNPHGRTMQYFTLLFLSLEDIVCRNSASLSRFRSNILNGFNRTMGISAAPMYFFFFSSSHIVRVTPALLHMTIFGNSTARSLSVIDSLGNNDFAIAGNPIKSIDCWVISDGITGDEVSRGNPNIFFNWSTNDIFVGVAGTGFVANPVAHQMAASTFIDCITSAICVSLLKLQVTICKFDGGLGKTSAAFAPSRTKAITFGTPRFNNSSTTYRPVRPVAPATTTFVTTSLVVSVVTDVSANALVSNASLTAGGRAIVAENPYEGVTNKWTNKNA